MSSPTDAELRAFCEDELLANLVVEIGAVMTRFAVSREEAWSRLSALKTAGLLSKGSMGSSETDYFGAGPGVNERLKSEVIAGKRPRPEK